MIFLTKVSDRTKHILKKVFNGTMRTLSIGANIGVPIYIGFIAYQAFTTGYTQVGWLFTGVTFLVIMTSRYERKYYKGLDKFETDKKLLTDRQRMYATCNNHRFDDINKTLEALKAEVKRLKEREGEQSREAVTAIKELMVKNDGVIKEIKEYTKTVKEKIEDGK